MACREQKLKVYTRNFIQKLKRSERNRHHSLALLFTLLSCEELVPILHICENWVPLLHIWEKSNQSFADDMNTYQFFTVKNEKDVKIWAQMLAPPPPKKKKNIKIDHTQISHFPKVRFWYQFYTWCEICEMGNLRFDRATSGLG